MSKSTNPEKSGREESSPLRIPPLSSCIVMFALVAILGCASEDNPVSPASGSWNVTLNVNYYDEFFRREVSTVPTDVVLSAIDGTMHVTLPQGTTTYTFSRLAYQSYGARVQAKGYFSSSATFSSSVYGSLVGVANLYRLPSSTSRIDSIACSINTIVPQVYFVLYTPQSLPTDGARSAVLFAGLRPDVSSRYGNYVFASSWLNQVPGTAIVQTDNLFRDLRAAGIASGVQIYVTARLVTGATYTGLDTTNHLYVYGNLEDNTRAVATFIMP